MPIYLVDGNEILSCYDLSGDSLVNAFDISGNEIFSGRYSINNVVSYFRQDTLSTCEQINALSDDWQSFIFITDTHGNGNKQHSQAIALYLLDNSPVFMIVLGGDYSIGNWSKSEYTTYMKPYVDSGIIDKIYAIFGNHETKGGGTAEAKACIYNDFLADKNWLSGNLQDNYYYFDDSENKTRFMFLNTSDGDNQYHMSADQIAWIEQNVILPSSEWSLVVIGHVPLNTMGVPTYSNESNGSSITNAIKNCNGNIVGYICGHQHIDALYHDGNFEHVMLYCDKLENIDYYSGYSVTDRQAGTIQEQAVSVISFNTTTKQVVIRRVGVRSPNQALAYSY